MFFIRKQIDRIRSIWSKKPTPTPCSLKDSIDEIRDLTARKQQISDEIKEKFANLRDMGYPTSTLKQVIRLLDQGAIIPEPSEKTARKRRQDMMDWEKFFADMPKGQSLFATHRGNHAEK